MRFLKFISAAVIGALVGILTGYASFRSYDRTSFFDWLKDSGTTQNVQEALLWVFVGALVGAGLWWAWTIAREDKA
jgi:NhaP-type Na+/H+ or K+/H+ antiporter